MNYENEINSLNSETLALQSILTLVLHSIAQTAPKLMAAMRIGFVARSLTFGRSSRVVTAAIN
jgi:hypothetical protein